MRVPSHVVAAQFWYAGWRLFAVKSAVTGEGWPLVAWIVVAVWTLVLSVLAVRVYQRDTART